METRNDNLDERVGDIRIRSEEIGFKSDEMLPCGKCGKANPPNRFECLYCGTALDLPDNAAANLRITPREVETWEKAVNVVVSGGSHLVDTQMIAEAAASMSIDDGRLESAVNFPSPSPIHRLSSEADAAEVRKRLETLGFNVSVIPDEALNADNPPVRLRSLEFWDDKLILTAFNSLEKFEFDVTRLILIVPGTIIETRSESILRKTRKETKNLNETNFASDYGVIDIYFAEDSLGYRITAYGFDFSCLGSDKGILAAENLGALSEKLKKAAPLAVFVGDYIEKKNFLDLVWGPTRVNESKGVKRVGLVMARAKGEITSNNQQFTKYSRLQRLLI
jgi:hypothetical protein